MKRVLLVMLAVCMIAALAACGPSREQIAEAQAEQYLEQMSGGEVDVDIKDGGDSMTITNNEGDTVITGDGDSVTITSEDGETVGEISGGQAWPSGDLPAYVPEVAGVNVTATVQSGPSIMVTFDGCSQSTAEGYKGLMEAAGWNITAEMNMDGQLVLVGQMGESEMLQFTWDSEDGSGGITYGVS